MWLSLVEIPRARLTVAVVIATALAAYGRKRRSLSTSGAVAGWITGFLTLACGGYRAGAVLIAFFLSSSFLTKYKKEHKRKLEADFDLAAERTAVQVLANSLAATVACVAYWGETRAAGGVELPLAGAGATRAGLLLVFVLAHYCACCGDTWASELGVLARSPPRLVTAPWRVVPPGTNGAMSPMGTAASLAGGLFLGLVFWLGSLAVAEPSAPGAGSEAALCLGLGAAAGLFGSFVDSLLGATLQQSAFDEDRHVVVSGAAPRKGLKHISGWDVLDNHAVNWLAALLTGLTAVALVACYGPS